MHNRQKRLDALSKTQQNIHSLICTGGLDRYKYKPQHIKAISGAKVGTIKINVGLDTDKLHTTLKKKAANLIAWDFPGNSCFVYREGRYVVVEAAWPPELEISEVRLSDCAQRPDKAGVFLTGMNALGDIIALTIDDRSCPHVLIGGASGSGKTTAMINFVLQAARWSVPLVICDIKGDMANLRDVKGQIGPLAMDLAEIRAALTWAVAQMNTRFRLKKEGRFNGDTPIFVIIDEVQESTSIDDAIAESIRQIATKGRSVKVHLIAGTQKPLVKVFGSQTTKANLSGRLALRVNDDVESRVLIGGPEPRADYLMPFEAYVVTPAELYRRALLFNATDDEIERAPKAAPKFDRWPELAVSNALEVASKIVVKPDPLQAAIAHIAALEGKGRDPLKKALSQADVPMGSHSNLAALGKWSKEVVGHMEAMGYFCR